MNNKIVFADEIIIDNKTDLSHNYNEKVQFSPSPPL